MQDTEADGVKMDPSAPPMMDMAPITDPSSEPVYSDDLPPGEMPEDFNNEDPVEEISNLEGDVKVYEPPVKPKPTPPAIIPYKDNGDGTIDIDDVLFGGTGGMITFFMFAIFSLLAILLGFVFTGVGCLFWVVYSLPFPFFCIGMIIGPGIIIVSNTAVCSVHIAHIIACFDPFGTCRYRKVIFDDNNGELVSESTLSHPVTRILFGECFKQRTRHRYDAIDDFQLKERGPGYEIIVLTKNGETEAILGISDYTEREEKCKALKNLLVERMTQ